MPLRHILCIAAFALALLVIVALCIGTYPIDPMAVWPAMVDKFRGANPVAPEIDAVIFQIRGPRILAALPEFPCAIMNTFVHRVTGLDAIEAYFARLADGRITFERMDA